MFLENADMDMGNVRTREGDLLIQEACAEVGLIPDHLLAEVNIVRLDKNAKKARVISQATTVLAKEYNDPLFKQLKVLNQKRMILKQKIHTKYGARAKSRAMQVLRDVGVTKNDLG